MATRKTGKRNKGVHHVAIIYHVGCAADLRENNRKRQPKQLSNPNDFAFDEDAFNFTND